MMYLWKYDTWNYEIWLKCMILMYMYDNGSVIVLLSIF